MEVEAAVLAFIAELNALPARAGRPFELVRGHKQWLIREIIGYHHNVIARIDPETGNVRSPHGNVVLGSVLQPDRRTMYCERGYVICHYLGKAARLEALRLADGGAPNPVRADMVKHHFGYKKAHFVREFGAEILQ